MLWNVQICHISHSWWNVHLRDLHTFFPPLLMLLHSSLRFFEFFLSFFGSKFLNSRSPEKKPEKFPWLEHFPLKSSSNSIFSTAHSTFLSTPEWVDISEVMRRLGEKLEFPNVFAHCTWIFGVLRQWITLWKGILQLFTLKSECYQNVFPCWFHTISGS